MTITECWRMSPSPLETASREQRHRSSHKGMAMTTATKEASSLTPETKAKRTRGRLATSGNTLLALAPAHSACRSREEDEESELGEVGPIDPEEAEFLEDDLEDEPVRQLIVADHSLPSIPNPAPSDGKVNPAFPARF
jgi:hypothetical protein